MIASSAPHVLHIEDSEGDIEFLRFAFEESRTEVRFTIIRDGANALRHVDAMAAGTLPLPDLILLDIKLPKVNGHAILHHLRAHPSLAQLPVVILRGSHNRSDRDRSLALGATAHLVKPMGISESLALIRHLQTFLPHPQPPG